MPVSSWIGLWRREQGSTSIEYALALAAIISVALLWGNLFESTTGAGHFETIAARLQETSESSDPRPTTASAAAPRPNEASWRVSIPGWMLLLVTVLLTATSLTTFLAQRRRMKKSAGKQADQLDPAVVVKRHERQRRYVHKRQELFRALSHNMHSVFESHVTVGQIMSTHVITVRPSTPRAEMIELMHDLEFHHLLVCDEQKHLLGIISDRDLKSSTGACATEVMTHEPVTVTEDLDLRRAISLALERRISCLPVVRDRRLLGVLTTTDLTMMLQVMLKLLNDLSKHEHGSPEKPSDPDLTDELEFVESCVI